MRRIWGHRAGIGLGVVAGSMALVTLSASPAAASPLFSGAGRGPTAETAIQSALWDGMDTAQSVGRYGPCTIVGEPQTFETFNDPNFGHVVRASVTITCEP